MILIRYYILFLCVWIIFQLIIILHNVPVNNLTCIFMDLYIYLQLFPGNKSLDLQMPERTCVTFTLSYKVWKLEVTIFFRPRKSSTNWKPPSLPGCLLELKLPNKTASSDLPSRRFRVRMHGYLTLVDSSDSHTLGKINTGWILKEHPFAILQMRDEWLISWDWCSRTTLVSWWKAKRCPHGP